MATSEADIDAPASPLADLSAFQRDVLVLLDRAERPSGLDVKRALQDAYDTPHINHGQLYPNLDRLVEMGLVEKGQVDARTNYYALTARGRRELAADRAWRGVATEAEDA